MKRWTAPVVAGLWVVGCGFFDFPAPERAPKDRDDGGEAGTRTGGGGTSGTSGANGGGASGTAGEGMNGGTAGDLPEGGTSGASSGAAGAGDGGASGAGEGGASGSPTGGAGGSGGSGGSGGGPTEPLMPGLRLWLDAASLPGNGPLVTWPNRVTNGEPDASQPGEMLRPVLGTVDGRRGVSFNGAQWMTFGEGFGTFNGGLTLFLVARFDAPSVCTEVFQVSNGLEVDDISLQTDLAVADPGALLFEVENVNLRTGPQVLDDSVPMLATVVVRSPDIAFLYLNAVEGAMETGAMFVPESVTRVENYLGSGLYLNCDPFEGVIFEFLLYNRGLAVEDIAEVNAYLQQKWDCCDG